LAETDDVLSREVAIAAELDEKGLSVQAKSRAAAALDWLVGSILDWSAAYFEGKAQGRRQQDETQRPLKDAQTKVAELQIMGLPELGASLIHEVLKDKYRKNINTEGVALEAINAMKDLPRPEVSSDIEANENIDEDWMNQVVRYAEDGSSERLQQVWGRVLAGEIVKPGSFSRHTLRFVAELDKETAENCELVDQHVIGDWISKDKRWYIGRHFVASVDMQRLGVIEGVGAGAPQNSLLIAETGRSILPGT